jgi:hypothetical protein
VTLTKHINNIQPQLTLFLQHYTTPITSFVSSNPIVHVFPVTNIPFASSIRNHRFRIPFMETKFDFNSPVHPPLMSKSKSNKQQKQKHTQKANKPRPIELERKLCLAGMNTDVG